MKFWDLESVQLTGRWSPVPCGAAVPLVGSHKLSRQREGSVKGEGEAAVDRSSSKKPSCISEDGLKIFSNLNVSLIP